MAPRLPLTATARAFIPGVSPSHLPSTFKAKKEATDYELVSYSSTKKEKKEKGEVVDEWFILKLTKKYLY